MTDLPALGAPIEAAEALESAAIEPRDYHPTDISRRLKVGAAALHELSRLRGYEAAISAAVSAYRATDPGADATLAGVVFGAQQALDAETLAARGGAADV